VSSVQLTCGRCGTTLPKPVPERCPQCGAKLGRVVSSMWGPVLALLAILAMFAAVLGFLYLMLHMR